jgi:hypothetical protein
MNWTSPVTIFDDEDEEALIAEYVRLSIEYPDYPPFAIAQEVFSDKRDFALRANQAALVWSNRLDIKERIRKGRRGDQIDLDEYTKAKWLAEILATSRDDTMPANAKKVKLDGLRDYGDGMGWRVKPAEPKGEGEGRKRQHASFTFVKYDD